MKPQPTKVHSESQTSQIIKAQQNTVLNRSKPTPSSPGITQEATLNLEAASIVNTAYRSRTAAKQKKNSLSLFAIVETKKPDSIAEESTDKSKQLS